MGKKVTHMSQFSCPEGSVSFLNMHTQCFLPFIQPSSSGNRCKPNAKDAKRDSEVEELSENGSLAIGRDDRLPFHSEPMVNYFSPL